MKYWGDKNEKKNCFFDIVMWLFSIIGLWQREREKYSR